MSKSAKPTRPIMMINASNLSIQPTSAVIEDHPAIQPFILYRSEDPSGVSGTGVVAEGVKFSDGTVALRWITSEHPSTVFYQGGLDAVESVHGHGGATVILFLDRDGNYSSPFDSQIKPYKTYTGRKVNETERTSSRYLISARQHGKSSAHAYEAWNETVISLLQEKLNPGTSLKLVLGGSPAQDKTNSVISLHKKSTFTNRHSEALMIMGHVTRDKTAKALLETNQSTFGQPLLVNEKHTIFASPGSAVTHLVCSDHNGDAIVLGYDTIEDVR